MQRLIDYFKYSQGNIQAFAICCGVALLFLILFFLTFRRRNPGSTENKIIKMRDANGFIRCKNCGKPLPSNAEFCSHCGNKVG